MPRAIIPAQSIPVTGLASINFQAATNNDAFVGQPGAILLVNNGSASSITVTIPSNLTLDGLVVPDRTITVPTLTIMAFEVGGVINEGIESDGTFWVNYSSITTVTVAVLQA